MVLTKPLSLLLLVAALGCPVAACQHGGSADAKARVTALAPSYKPKLAELRTTVAGLRARVAAIPASVQGASALRESVFEFEHHVRTLTIYLAEFSPEIEAAVRSGTDAELTSLQDQIRTYMEREIAELTTALPTAAAALAKLETAAH